MIFYIYILTIYLKNLLKYIFKLTLSVYLFVLKTALIVLNKVNSIAIYSDFTYCLCFSILNITVFTSLVCTVVIKLNKGVPQMESLLFQLFEMYGFTVVLI